MMHSCLYRGWVRHRRFEPVHNEFQYSVFFAYLDLKELDRVFAGRWFWSTSRRAVARFRRTDHFGCAEQSLCDSVRDLVEQQTGTRPNGPIRVLTQLRFWGYLMNPVAFFYCFDEAGTEVESVVAEVTNTPWGERHCYVLDQETVKGAGPNTRKEFHVSPFMGMNMEYSWKVGTPGETLSLHIDEPRTRRLRQAQSPLSPASDQPTPSSPIAGERVRVRGPQRTSQHVTTTATASRTEVESEGHSISPHPSPLPRTTREEVGTDTQRERGRRAPFDVTMQLSRRPITGAELAKTLTIHPFMTGKIAAAIYWQALKLWWKGCPFVPHPKRNPTASAPVKPQLPTASPNPSTVPAP